MGCGSRTIIHCSFSCAARSHPPQAKGCTFHAPPIAGYGLPPHFSLFTLLLFTSPAGRGLRSAATNHWQVAGLRRRRLRPEKRDATVEATGFVPLPARAFGATAPAGKGNLCAKGQLEKPAARNRPRRRAARSTHYPSLATACPPRFSLFTFHLLLCLSARRAGGPQPPRAKARNSRMLVQAFAGCGPKRETRPSKPPANEKRGLSGAPLLLSYRPAAARRGACAVSTARARWGSRPPSRRRCSVPRRQSSPCAGRHSGAGSGARSPC